MLQTPLKNFLTTFANLYNSMNKINYQKELDRVIDKIMGEGKVPKLLLHVCCAPCSSYCLEYLSKYFDITVYFYNPNISIADEYNYRLSEEKRLVSLMPFEHPVKVIEGEYLPKDYFEYVKGLENEPEGGKRCEKCFRLRLESSARYAKEHGFDYFTTTLTISPLKNAQKLNEIGSRLAEEYHVACLPSDFKKKGGYLKSIELSAEYQLYRQDYCGCVYSKAAREREKQQKALES